MNKTSTQITLDHIDSIWNLTRSLRGRSLEDPEIQAALRRLYNEDFMKLVNAVTDTWKHPVSLENYSADWE